MVADDQMADKATITLLLADDHQIVRQGMRALLETEQDFRVIGEAGDGLEAVRLSERLRPDILILDLMLPGLHGLEVIRRARKQAPHTRIVVLSMHANESYVLQALRNGAAAYVLKDCEAAVLITAVRQVAAGYRYLCPPLAARAIEVYIEKHDALADPHEALTPREREVLQLTAEGYTSAQIAARFFLSRRTVETHRANMMRKLGLRTRTDLVRYAMQRGLIPPK
jgi:DNA-binding NarL/FixJ family response regulator